MVRVCTAHVTVHTRQNIYCLTAYNFPFTIMLDHLRHTLILLSVGLLFFSCSTDEPDTSGREMKFDISSVSRSAVTTAENITKNPLPFSPTGFLPTLLTTNQHFDPPCITIHRLHIQLPAGPPRKYNFGFTITNIRLWQYTRHRFSPLMMPTFPI